MGSSNMAARRGAKAARRKAIVAQKRKTQTLGQSIAAQAARAATSPILHCLLSENLFETGMGSLVLVRGSAIGQSVIAAFLLDTFCLGVKDVMCQTVEGRQVAAYLAKLGAASPMAPVDPSYARKLLHDLVQWAGSLGIQPHQDFAAAEVLFRDVDPLACSTAFRFGQDGKPTYIAGPTESPLSVRRRIDQLTRRLGPDGFHYLVPA